MRLILVLVLLGASLARADETIVGPGGPYQVYDWPDGDRTMQTPRGETWTEYRWRDRDSTIVAPDDQQWQRYRWDDDSDGD